MASFLDKKRFTTDKSIISIDGDLPVGTYLMKLTVVDNAGNRSKAAKAKIRVFKRLIITEPVVIDPVRPILIGPLRPEIRLRRPV